MRLVAIALGALFLTACGQTAETSVEEETPPPAAYEPTATPDGNNLAPATAAPDGNPANAGAETPEPSGATP